MCSCLFRKYARVVPLKGKRRTSIVNAFQKIVSKGCRPIKYRLIRVVNFTMIFEEAFENKKY